MFKSLSMETTRNRVQNIVQLKVHNKLVQVYKGSRSCTLFRTEDIDVYSSNKYEPQNIKSQTTS